jgi:hypothetical protein
MQYPTPDDPARAPVWENYVGAQAAQAALGLTPAYVHAAGVEVDGTRVCLVVQCPPDSPAHDDQDIADMVDGLSDLLGPDVDVAKRVDVRQRRTLRPDDGVIWFYARR